MQVKRVKIYNKVRRGKGKQNQPTNKQTNGRNGTTKQNRDVFLYIHRYTRNPN